LPPPRQLELGLAPQAPLSLAPVLGCCDEASAEALVITPIAQPTSPFGPTGDQLIMGDFKGGLATIRREGDQARLAFWIDHALHEVRGLPVWCPPVRGEVATAPLPRSVGPDVMGPLALRKIAAGAKTEGGDQFPFVNKPQLDLAVVAAAG
jgi:hypothetical protein